MSKKSVMLQISTGGYTESRVSYSEIEKTLKNLLERMSVEAVIIGWACDRKLYGQVNTFLKAHGVKSFLWLPVFSETGVLDSRAVKLMTEQGTEAESYSLTAGENFEFYCPNQSVNTEAFLEIYEKYFDGLDFDGVFLDKIRYGTFANGLGGVFSCFCNACMRKYKEAGLDVEVLKAEMQRIRSNNCNNSSRGQLPLGIQAYSKGRYQFWNPTWERFFEIKSECVTAAVEGITAYFHRKNMLVGIDVFAPFLGYFAGQDVKRLSGLADFVKPMMYRITQAPAGLPFETDCLIKETTGCVNAAEENGAKIGFLRAIGCQEETLDGFDLEFVKQELLSMTKCSASVYCGIEINRNDVAPAGPEYVRANLEAFAGLPIHGYVLSWDLLSAPKENLEVVTEYFGKEK